MSVPESIHLTSTLNLDPVSSCILEQGAYRSPQTWHRSPHVDLDNVSIQDQCRTPWSPGRTT
jgi:hypothetical protein